MNTRRFLLAVFAFALMLPLPGCGCRRNSCGDRSLAPPPSSCCPPGPSGTLPPGYMPSVNP